MSLNPEQFEEMQKLAGMEEQMMRAMLNEAETDTLQCPDCGGRIFVMHTLVEAFTIKVPALLNPNLHKKITQGQMCYIGNKKVDDITFRTTARIFMCPNPKCKNKVVARISYGTILQEGVPKDVYKKIVEKAQEGSGPEITIEHAGSGEGERGSPGDSDSIRDSGGLDSESRADGIETGDSPSSGESPQGS